MARALVLGNGTSLVCLDKHGYVRDIHYHYVGLENHVCGHKHRIGIMVDDQFSWLDDGNWEINIGYKPGTMVGQLVCKNQKLQISLVMEDILYNETDVFLRQVDIYNHSDNKRFIKLFFHQVFMIYENKKRNTAFYDPTHNLIVHYKGRRVFIVNGKTENGGVIDDYCVGAYQFGDKEGTFRDAEDGKLGKNAVEHGSVDSVIRLSTCCEPKMKARAYYWISIGKSFAQAYELNQMVHDKTPEGMIHSTEDFWHAWLDKQDIDTTVISDEQKKLFDTSLFVLRAHTDNRGSIIASADSEMIEYGKDDYTYMWPRDAAFITTSLDKAGFTEVTKPFFRFCQEVLHPDGYLHHRFNSDRSLGSTWHSTTAQKEWLRDRILQLPIQEDESAGVLYAIGKHYKYSKDLEFIESLYKPLIEKIAQFLVKFRNSTTGLPLPSYDLWEEKIGISTYTCSAVYGGLITAANISELLGKRGHMREYKEAAAEIKAAMSAHLFSQRLNAFVRNADYIDGQIVLDNTLDASSLFGLWYFEAFDQDDPQFISTQAEISKKLTNPTAVGGMIRYENDSYFRRQNLSNPWLITTMWEAARLLHKKQVTAEDLSQVEATINWVIKQMYPSGVLPEQLDPNTGEALSATPLVWSHSVYVDLILTYLQAKKNLTAAPLPTK